MKSVELAGGCLLTQHWRYYDTKVKLADGEGNGPTSKKAEIRNVWQHAVEVGVLHELGHTLLFEFAEFV